MHVCKHTYTKADIYTQTIANTQTQHILGRNNVSTEVCHSVCICVCMSMRMHTNTIPAADTIESAPMTVSTGPQYSVISGFKPFVCAKPQIKWEIVARSNTLSAPPVLTICHNMSWYVTICLDMSWYFFFQTCHVLEYSRIYVYIHWCVCMRVYHSSPVMGAMSQYIILFSLQTTEVSLPS